MDYRFSVIAAAMFFSAPAFATPLVAAPQQAKEVIIPPSITQAAAHVRIAVAPSVLKSAKPNEVAVPPAKPNEVAVPPAKPNEVAVPPAKPNEVAVPPAKPNEIAVPPA